MGRTFGLLIVSIGLWLVFSLPTRGPATDNAGSVVVPVPTPVPVAAPLIAGASSVAGSETRATNLGGSAIAASSLPSVVLLRPDERTAAAPIVVRPKRGQDERVVAARNREFESEPEVAAARPPEPVPVTATKGLSGSNGLAGTPESKTARIVVPSDAQAGQIRIVTTAVAPAPSTAASQATVARQLPAQPVIGAMGGSPSRIVEAARRDLAMAMVSMPGPSTQGANQERGHDALAGARAATDGGLRTAQNGPNDKPVNKRKPGNGDNEKPAVVAKRVVVRAPVRDETRVVVSVLRPQQQRVRITQAYAPPSYVGRVVVRYPGPMFVPSSASFGRSQFRGDAMWDSIRRNGM